MLITREHEVTEQCDMCGACRHMTLTDKEMDAFRKYLRGGSLIQECLPGLNKCEREFLKSGYCPDCQELIFGNGETERIS